MSVQNPDDLDAFFHPTHEVRKRRGSTVFMIILITLVVVGAILAVVADIVARNYAEKRAAAEIESSLPAGSTGAVDVEIHGLSVLLQALNGSLDDVTLTSSDLVVEKIPLTFTADLSDVPLKAGGTTGAVTGRVVVSEAALNKTKAVGDLGGRVALGDGEFTFDKTLTFLGQSAKAQITATPTLSKDGSRVTVEPTSAKVNGAALPGYLEPLLKTVAPRVCVADYVPAKATVSKLTVRPSGLTINLRSAGLPLSRAGLTGTGSCS